VPPFEREDVALTLWGKVQEGEAVDVEAWRACRGTDHDALLRGNQRASPKPILAGRRRWWRVGDAQVAGAVQGTVSG
jgi:hypothetical protein